MNKKLLASSLLMSALLLTSCNFSFASTKLVVKDSTTYYVGQNYEQHNNATAYLSSGLSKQDVDFNGKDVTFHNHRDPDGQSFNLSDPFSKIGQYSLTVKYKDKYSTTLKFNVADGAYLPEELTFLSEDIQTNYAPAIGEQKMLVIPIKLKPGTATTYSEWTPTKLASVESYYFSDSSSPVSLTNYYSTASFDQIHISGMVSDVYEETNNSLTMSAISADGTYQKLFQLIQNAVAWVENHYSEQDWSEYDTNGDGCLDSIHLITNYNAYDWNTPLWPHMYETGNIGTLSKPAANVYSMSAINHVSSAITAIHEQGHIFGLQDYYDYTGGGTSNRDYVGQADMQSHNVFDWNSFSKLSVGWTKPLVVDGSKDSVTVTLRPASSTGDCLIVPTPGTWNGSAFDEYILIELFTKVGNNVSDWANWGTLGTGGVCLYHVDARIYGTNEEGGEYNAGLNGEIVDDVKNSSYKYHMIGANNSYDPTAYMSVPGFEKFKLLTLIQRGGTDTFGSSLASKRHKLGKEDLFVTGSTYTFEAYKQFFLKNTSKVATTMNDGTTFPYTITFDSVTETEAVITINK